MAAGGKIDLAQKIIVQTLRPVAGRPRIEDITGNDKDIHLFFLQGTGKPAQKGREFLIAFLAEKRPSEVPVRGMEYAHDTKAVLCRSPAMRGLKAAAGATIPVIRPKKRPVKARAAGKVLTKKPCLRRAFRQ